MRRLVKASVESIVNLSQPQPVLGTRPKLDAAIALEIMYELKLRNALPIDWRVVRHICSLTEEIKKSTIKSR